MFGVGNCVVVVCVFVMGCGVWRCVYDGVFLFVCLVVVYVCGWCIFGVG